MHIYACRPEKLVAVFITYKLFQIKGQSPFMCLDQKSSTDFFTFTCSSQFYLSVEKGDKRMYLKQHPQNITCQQIIISVLFLNTFIQTTFDETIFKRSFETEFL